MSAGFDDYRAQAQAEAAGEEWKPITDTGSAGCLPWVLLAMGIGLWFTPMIGLGIFGIMGSLFLFGARGVTEHGLKKIAATESVAEATVEFGIGCGGLVAYALIGAILLGLLVSVLGSAGLMKGVTGF